LLRQSLESERPGFEFWLHECIIHSHTLYSVKRSMTKGTGSTKDSLLWPNQAFCSGLHLPRRRGIFSNVKKGIL
jgi:hypothetical protein